MRVSSLFVAAVATLSSTVSATILPVRSSDRAADLLTNFPGQDPLPTLSDILHLNATNGTFLPLENIQADIFVGMKKPRELFYFFRINEAALFKAALRNNVISLVTSAAQIISPPAQQPFAFLNIAFSHTGLATLGILDTLGDPMFTRGQWADAPNLNDDTSKWEDVWKDGSIHGVFLIGSDDQSNIDNLLSTITGFFGSSITEQTRIQGAARPGNQAGHEHFGFLDGISNPAISGFAVNVRPGQSIVPTGVIVTGRFGDFGLRAPWTRDGSFLVFRKLQQLVPEFNNYLTQNAVQNAAGTLTVQQGAELFGARMMGRWRSGAPVDLSPTADDPALGADPHRNNNFNFAHFGSNLINDQSSCPFSAHIRKVRPRTDLLNLNVFNQAIRAGTTFGPEVTPDESSSGTTSQLRGLAFVEYQSSISNGFRFQQMNWMDTANFPPLKNQTVGIDGIMGQAGGGKPKTTFGLDPQDASRSYSIPEFVKPLGGEYFFSPSIPALQRVIAGNGIGIF